MPVTSMKPNMFRVQLFRDEAGISALAPAWRSLTARLELRRHFHHVEWYLALAHTLERHGQTSVECLAVFRDDALVAVFPYRRVHLQVGTIPLRVMRLVSDPVDAPTARDFIAAPATAKAGFFGGFVNFIAQNDPNWDLISLQGILEDSIAATALKNSAPLPLIEATGGAWGQVEFITCGEADRPFERLSKGFRQNLRTSHHKLTSRRVAFDVARTPSDLERLLPEFLKVESSGWKGAQETSVLKQPEVHTFVRQLISQFGPHNNCEIHLMRVDNEAIAALFGIVTDGIWYLFKIGYDEAHHLASPGHLLIENLLKRNNVQKAFDILTPYNAPPWFHAWKPNSTQKIFNVHVFRPSADGARLAKEVEAIMRGSNQTPPSA